jgi:hypothetical protein
VKRAGSGCDEGQDQGASAANEARRASAFPSTMTPELVSPARSPHESRATALRFEDEQLDEGAAVWAVNSRRSPGGRLQCGRTWRRLRARGEDGLPWHIGS